MQASLSYPNNSPKRVRRTSFDFALIFLILVTATLILALVFWQFWHANRIFTGTRVANVPIGGMTRIEAVNHLNRKLRPYPLPPVSLNYEGNNWPLAGLAIGTTQTSLSQSNASQATSTTSVDLISAVNRAYLIGRDSSLRQQIQEQLLSLLIGINIEPEVTFSRGQLRHMVALLSEQVRQPAQPAREINGVVIPPQTGVSVDVEATLQKLSERLTSDFDSATPIVVPFVVHQTLAERLTTSADSATAASTVTTANNALAELEGPSTSLVLRSEDGMVLAIDPATMDSLLFSKSPPQVDRIVCST